MKKFVSILLLVLYTMSVSASVVTIRYCGAMQGKVMISAWEKDDCCCSRGRQMDMHPGIVKSDTGLAVLHDTVTPKSCCTEIILQSRLTANQLVSSETGIIVFQAPQLYTAAYAGHFEYRPSFLKLHQPMADALKAPPPAIPLYKLFHRFTYYG